MRYLFLLLILLNACSIDLSTKSDRYCKFKLANGEIIECRKRLYGSGSTDYKDCKSGYIYRDQINVTELQCDKDIH